MDSPSLSVLRAEVVSLADFDMVGEDEWLIPQQLFADQLDAMRELFVGADVGS